MKNPAAFISYARRDDKAYSRRITGIRERLQGLVGAAIGRDFEIFQDCEGIAWGQHWRTRVDEALEEALFLIPILTPSYFNSQACRAELEAFLELERRHGRKDRVLSLYFLTEPVYEQKTDPLAAILHERQHRDWRHLRVDPLGSAKVMRALDSLAAELAAAIHARQTAASPPARVLSAATQTPALETISPTPRESEATVAPPAGEEPSTVLRRTEIRAGDTLDLSDSTVLSRLEIRQPGTAFRDINEPWCPELVVIPAGSFVMGSPEDEEGRDSSEGPQHEVRFAKPFALGKYPVTFEEYDHFCTETRREKPPDQSWGRGRRPAINVSWEDANAYIEWLSKITGQPYRAPSEAEWEYAARAGSETAYWWGDEAPTPEQANFGRNVGKTTQVGSYPANPWGLHDMYGNVWEWVEDCWDDSYKGAPTDGSAWLKGTSSLRVLRGGSWGYGSGALRSALRGREEPDECEFDLGFRVSRTLTP